MKKNPTQLDFQYAVRHTRVILPVKRHIDTFGNTMIRYSLITEPMDETGKARIREGRMQTLPPRIILPSEFARQNLEGFGAEAKKYLDHMRAHEKEIRILQYGYTLKNESFNEHVVTETVEAVAERVKTEVETKNDPFSCVILGVDEPWDVCLLHFFCLTVQNSISGNMRELEARRLQELHAGMPAPIRDEVEKAFSAAEKDASLITALGALLRKHGVFEHYQDRFFALVNRSN